METERLRFRLIETSDAEFLLELMTSPKWHKMIGDRGVYSLEDSVKYIEDRMDADLRKKGFINHVMIDKLTSELVGTCSLHNRDGVDGIDIGYAIHPKQEGKGYATEGAKEMIRLAFEKYSIDQVHAITSDQNVSSYKVLEKIGFDFKGYIRLPKSTEEIRLYSLTKKEFNA